MSLDETMRVFDDERLNSEIEELFERLIAEYDEKEDCGVWVLIPDQVSLLAKSSSIIQKTLSDKSAKVTTTVFDDSIEMGTIVITGGKSLTFTDASIVADIARSGAGIDISALNNGDVEVVFGFKTAKKVAKG